MPASKGSTKKRPWGIGLLSIIPGLGFIVLGKIAAGLSIMAGMVLFIFLFLITTPTDLSAWFFVLAFILWMVQLIFAMLAAMGASGPRRSSEAIARREARRAQGESMAIQRMAREALARLLAPGENLRFALSGSKASVDARILGELMLGLLNAVGGGGYAGGPSDPPITCIGVTENELVFTTTRRIPKPSDLRRVPLGDVSIVEFKEGRLGFDKLILGTGHRTFIRLHTVKSLRPAVGELTDILHK